MPSFQAKTYQQEALNSISAYFRECQNRGHADYAFQEITKQLWGRKSNFTPLKGFPEEMPYFCLRVPTGGGKTYLAAKSVSLVNNHLLHTEHSVILWLVPSTAIRTQTMAALKNLDHPYHAALREAGPAPLWKAAPWSSSRLVRLSRSRTKNNARLRKQWLADESF